MPQKNVLSNIFRKLITKLMVATRLPYNPFAGEMLPLERIRLYQWLNQYRPQAVLEVGTGVGGSTFYISEALKRNGGTLYTCDPLRRPPQKFLDRFAETLNYQPLKSNELIDLVENRKIHLDMIFFDGPEIPGLALEDIQRLERTIQPGCLFAMHDWEQPGGPNDRIVSIKAKLIRPYLEQSSAWKQIDSLSGHHKNVWWTKGMYDSVGLCLYEFLGRPSGSAANAA